MTDAGHNIRSPPETRFAVLDQSPATLSNSIQSAQGMTPAFSDQNEAVDSRSFALALDGDGAQPNTPDSALVYIGMYKLQSNNALWNYLIFFKVIDKAGALLCLIFAMGRNTSHIFLFHASQPESKRLKTLPTCGRRVAFQYRRRRYARTFSNVIFSTFILSYLSSMRGIFLKTMFIMDINT